MMLLGPLTGLLWCCLPRFADGQRRPFSVSLFPYIPDAGNDGLKGLRESLVSKFNAENRDITLEIKDWDLDPYTMTDLEVMLGPSGVDMVEVDTLLLGDLVQKNLIQTIRFTDFPLNDFYPPSLIPVSLNGEVYAIPTYLCSFWIYSWDARPSLSTGISSLASYLTESSTVGGTPIVLVGNFDGSWTFPSIYFDAFKDTFESLSYDTLGREYYSRGLNDTVMQWFRMAPPLCGPPTADNANKCLDGSFKNGEAEALFGLKLAAGHFGFSETLFNILNASRTSDLPYIVSAPFGQSSSPTMFVDGLVLSTYCKGSCYKDAQTFSQFMSRADVRELIAFSLDVPEQEGRIPRYLMQSTWSFYRRPMAQNSPIYRAIFDTMNSGILPFNNQGFSENRNRINTQLKDNFGISSKIMAVEDKKHNRIVDTFSDIASYIESAFPAAKTNTSLLERLEAAKEHALQNSGKVRYRFYRADMGKAAFVEPLQQESWGFVKPHQQARWGLLRFIVPLCGMVLVVAAVALWQYRIGSGNNTAEHEESQEEETRLLQGPSLDHSRLPTYHSAG